jgi:hypothetical protein
MAPEMPEAIAASPISATAATLRGVLNPHAAGEAGTYQFSYSRSKSTCQEDEVLAPEPPGSATGAEKEAVSEELTGLLPGTSYTFCLIARNSLEEPAISEPLTFRTLDVQPTVSEEGSINVTETGATLTGEIDPGGSETSFYFEYGTSQAYGKTTPKWSLLSTDASEHTASATIEGLQASTRYFYRLVATNGMGTTFGVGQSFTTQITGGVLALPDERQYELVSPPDKGGGQAFGIIGFNGVAIGGSAATQASENGDGMTYLTSTPTGSTPPGNANATQLLSTRGASSWASDDISPSLSNPIGVFLNDGEPYRLFSPDLSHAVIQQPEDSEISLRTSATGALQILPLTETPPDTFVAASKELSHVALESPGGLYEWSGAALTQVNLLPGGEPDENGRLGGIDTHTLGPSEFAGRNAISSDGDRIVWGDGSQLFSRDMLTGEEVQVDADDGGSGSGGGVFQMANSSGSRVFFTDGQSLTASATANDLYMFNVEDDRLDDLGAAGVALAANEEGTILYVVSSEILDGQPNSHHEVAIEGSSNIFMLQEDTPGSWTTTFIATLSGSDDSGYFHNGAQPENLAHWSMRSSPDGEYLAFMSNRSLTGYDNRDAVSGEPDEEVFLYSAQDGGLVCASCNPTGARPNGEQDTGEYPGLPMDPTRTWAITQAAPSGHWLAAAIPGWNEALTDENRGVPIYASRVVSDSGRLFFDSSDGLVPGDTNGTEDVYEYEPGGIGSCASALPGCVALISSGKSGNDSDFVDASLDGNDVFFTTTDRLTAADVDNATDMYDAHVCTAMEPCYPASSVASPPCDSTDSCHPSAVAQPGIYNAPATSTFSGAGNVSQAPVAAPKKTATQVRAEELTRALKSCRKKKNKRKRDACEAAARKRYGKHTAKKTAAAKKSASRGGK